MKKKYEHLQQEQRVQQPTTRTFTHLSRLSRVLPYLHRNSVSNEDSWAQTFISLGLSACLALGQEAETIGAPAYLVKFQLVRMLTS